MFIQLLTNNHCGTKTGPETTGQNSGTFRGPQQAHADLGVPQFSDPDAMVQHLGMCDADAAFLQSLGPAPRLLVQCRQTVLKGVKLLLHAPQKVTGSFLEFNVLSTTVPTSNICNAHEYLTSLC